ncbi:CBM20 domain-containing protein [Myxococcus sp. MxC21-1]|nr:CBM20 domain-containing protein [Myxococcus sp. MxC21-1]WNZ66058.1 CBM20 domain-containing protein [Myxococcus sp. MxC21-1]
MGGWKPERSLRPGPDGFALSLPVGAVFEYKLLRGGSQGTLDWEDGANRLLFVDEGTGPLRQTLAWSQR